MKITADEAYITQRIINAFIRENIFEFLNQATVWEKTEDIILRHWPEAPSTQWLVFNCSDTCVYLPVNSTDYLQHWQCHGYQWLQCDDNTSCVGAGYTAWLALFAPQQDSETIETLSQFTMEADAAVSQRQLCQQAYHEQESQLQQPLNDFHSWQQRMLHSDQIAAYLDHPYYPTARAKFGLDENDLRCYCPEYAPVFELHWLAVKCHLVVLRGKLPSFWPTFSDVGLSTSLSPDYVLLPVHPVTWRHLIFSDSDMIAAPQTALEVAPTLSVRSVVVLACPEYHIKVPLMMRTLGAKNIRLIKPSTLYDGHTFSQILTLIAKQDKHLNNLFLHCDEHCGGYTLDNKSLAYIIRHYPSFENTATLVPVAALASPMPDGRLYLLHLIDHYYAGDVMRWMHDYLTLLLTVNLRLWLEYGIALEANQQNAVIVFDVGRPLSLVMKDNDSARIIAKRCEQRLPILSEFIQAIKDPRILVTQDLSLAQMFTTITLQLNITPLLERLSVQAIVDREQVYMLLGQKIRQILDELVTEGVPVGAAEKYLLESEYLYVKYLLSAGSLLSKEKSGAADINKFYGYTGPNFLRHPV